MTIDQYKEIVSTSEKIMRTYNVFIENSDPNIMAGDIIAYKKLSAKLSKAISNEVLTEDEKIKLSKVLELYIKNPMPIRTLEDYRKQLFDACKGFEKSMENTTIIGEIFERDVEVFNRIIKEKPYLADEKLWKNNYSTYKKLMGNSQFRAMSQICSGIKEFEDPTLHMTIDELDSKTFLNDYFYDRVSNALVARIERAYSEKLKEATSEEDKLKIKEMLDRKIEQASDRLTSCKNLAVIEEVKKMQGDNHGI